MIEVLSYLLTTALSVVSIFMFRDRQYVSAVLAALLAIYLVNFASCGG